MSFIYCPFRKERVAAQPEEVVRQSLLKLMTEQLGYPPGGIVVEKALSQLPHLSLKGSRNLPDRRVDILVYMPNGSDGLVPLILIECKAVPLKHTALQQVAGYNHYIKAPYISVANAEQMFTGWYDEKSKGYRYVDFLPDFASLKKKLVHSENSER